MDRKEIIITNVMEKMHQLPLEFDDAGEFDIEPSLNDAMREMGIRDIRSVHSYSDTELFLELRTLWYVLLRYRNSASVNFKYKTGVNDGKSVDKTDIPKILKSIMDDLDDQFQQWRMTSYSGTTGSTWNMTRRESTRLK